MWRPMGVKNHWEIQKKQKKTKISLAFATKIRARSKLLSFPPALNEKRKASGSSHARRGPTSFSTRRRALFSPHRRRFAGSSSSHESEKGEKGKLVSFVEGCTGVVTRQSRRPRGRRRRRRRREKRKGKKREFCFFFF